MDEIERKEVRISDQFDLANISVSLDYLPYNG
jgi:hypothetical protein